MIFIVKNHGYIPPPRVLESTLVMLKVRCRQGKTSWIRIVLELLLYLLGGPTSKLNICKHG